MPVNIHSTEKLYMYLNFHHSCFQQKTLIFVSFCALKIKEQTYIKSNHCHNGTVHPQVVQGENDLQIWTAAANILVTHSQQEMVLQVQGFKVGDRPSQSIMLRRAYGLRKFFGTTKAQNDI